MIVPWSRRLAASVLAALASVATAYLANAVAFYLGDQFQIAEFASVVAQLWLVGVLTAVLVAVGALLGGFGTRWWALLTGAVAVVVAVALDALSRVGTAMFGILDTVLGFYFFFMIASVAAVALLGHPVYRAWLARRANVGHKVVLVRVPAQNLSTALSAAAPAEPVDPMRADTQWDAYIGAFLEAGWQTAEVAPADRLPDGVFVEDAAVVFDDVALLARSGAESRRAETTTVADALRARGFTIYELEEPGTLDGGDVLQVGDTVYVGRSARTNAEGVRQLRELVAGLPGERRVVAVPVTKALHLKSGATALPDGTVLLHPELVDSTEVFPRSIAVPEKSGANVVALSDTRILVPASAPQTAALIEDLGYETVVVDLGEFEKLDGSASCLSIRLY